MSGQFKPIWRFLVPVLFLFAHFAAHAQGNSVEVITLKYRTAEQVMPLLRPMLDKGGSMTGMQNQLIVRTSPGNLNDLRRILATIDAMPRRLLITVRQDAALERERTQSDISGRIVTGSGGVAVGETARGAGGVAQVQRGDDVLRARIDNTRSLSDDRNAHTVQVLEGNSAFINFGQSVPVQQTQVTPTIVNGRIVNSVNNTVQYRDAQSGFYVLPRVSGDRVTLDISPQRDTFAAPEQNLPPGSINTQRAATTVAGRLGEWIEIGGIAQSGVNQQSAILGSTRETSADNRRILVKVDEIR
jgi:type II secretory pathway component GspD/PulD (secretin)